MAKEKVLNIEGMSCQHCVGRVEKALKELAGVEEVSVDLEKEEAKLTYDDATVGVEDFKKAVEDAGYKVK